MVYVPARRVYSVPDHILVPDAGLPTACAPVEVLTERLNDEEIAVPPLLLMTCLMIWRLPVVTDGVVHHVGTVMLTLVSGVVTVCPKVNALPIHDVILSMVISCAIGIIVPWNVEFALSVVAPFGVQKTSQALAPCVSVTVEFATVLSAPPILKINVPAPLSVIPDVPIDITDEIPAVQYTPPV